MKSNGRAFLAALATLVASVAILLTLLAHYATVLTDPSSFSARAVRVVHAGPVESVVVNTITGRVLEQVGGESGLEPIIRGAVHLALSSGPVTQQIRAGAASLQQQLTTGQADVLSLTLPGIGPAVASTLESVSPQAAAVVGHLGTFTVLDVPIPPTAASALHVLTVLGRDSSLLIVFSAAVTALALILSPSRRGTLIALGMGAVVSGLLAAAVYIVGRGIVTSQFSTPGARTAAGTAWDVYLRGLESGGFLLAGAGLAVAALTALIWRRRRREITHLVSAR